MKNKIVLVVSIILVVSVMVGYNFASAGSEKSTERSNRGSQWSSHSANVSAQSTRESNNLPSQSSTTQTTPTIGMPSTNRDTPAHANNAQKESKTIREIPLELPNLETENIVKPSRILIQYLPGATEDLKTNLSRKIGISKIKEMKNKTWVLYEIPKGTTAQTVLNKVLEKKWVLIAEAEIDALIPHTLIPNDTYFSDQWHHKNIWSETAWDIQASSDIIIAVADTGVNRNHPDLQNNTLLTGFNTVTNSRDDNDILGHGTAVIGSIAAVGWNTLWVVWSAFRSKILPIKITADGSSSAYLSDIWEAISYASQAGAKIINISFWPLCTSSYFSDTAAIMRKNGWMVVVAGGNDGTQMPCSDNPNVVYVSATNRDNNKTSWSSYGNFIDISAPGESIATTAVDGGYTYVSGTSFSSPIVSGVLALMWSKNPALTADMLESILKKTALDRGDPGFDMYYWHGLVSSSGALNYIAQNTLSPEPTPDPITDLAPAKDIEAPVFTTLSHADGSFMPPRWPISFSAVAADNIAVKEISITFDGALIGKCIDNTYCKSFSFNTRKITAGAHTVIFIAHDAAGNTTSKEIKVYK